MAQYGLIKSFDIDNGELDGIPPHECFVLGYELADVDCELKGRLPINRPVHVQNLERIRKSIAYAGRTGSLTFVADDPSESWMLLLVDPR